MTPEERRQAPLDPLTWAIGIATFIFTCGAVFALIILASDLGVFK